MMLWSFASPPALALALVKLVFFYSDLSFGATALYIFMVVGALAGLIILGVVRGQRPVECDCPACGERVWFEFTRRAVGPEPLVARCEKCLAYVVLRDRQIAEAPLETLADMQRFWVYTEQYERRVRRDAGIRFNLPRFCAVCGAADAPYQREIWVLLQDRGVNDEVWRELNYARTGSRGHGNGTRPSTPTGITGRDFLDLKVPTCELHKKYRAEPEPLICDDSGTLSFASYRYYKAFCVGNHIAPADSDGMPVARVHDGSR